MGQPTPYSRQADFTDFEASNPSTPKSGVSLDAEFNAVLVTLVGILANLARIQRDDGRLANQSVTIDALSPAALVALGAGAVWLPRGSWVTATAYHVSDVIQSGTASYVCAIAHTSAASLSTDITAGRWVKLFDDAGATPADGSVTAAKLAAGAVVTAAIGFTGLDLSGSIRAATGLQAGTGTLGALLHAKKTAGDALARLERATDAQGAVGYQIAGVSVTWQLAMEASSDVLALGLAGAATTLFRGGGGIDHTGHMRATGSAAPASGAGISIYYSTSIGYLDTYDHTAATWLPMKLRGSTVTLTASAVDVLSASSTGVNFPLAVQRGGVDIGYLDIPQNVQSTGYTLALTDRGKHIYSANVVGQTIAIPTNAAVGFPVGTAVTIVNDGSNAITVSTTGITLKLAGAGTTGNRTIAANGLATLIKVGTDKWFISGAGIS
jgi:hypothetical protein